MSSSTSPTRTARASCSRRGRDVLRVRIAGLLVLVVLVALLAAVKRATWWAVMLLVALLLLSLVWTGGVDAR